MAKIELSEVLQAYANLQKLQEEVNDAIQIHKKECTKTTNLLLKIAERKHDNAWGCYSALESAYIDQQGGKTLSPY